MLNQISEGLPCALDSVSKGIILFLRTTVFQCSVCELNQLHFPVCWLLVSEKFTDMRFGCVGFRVKFLLLNSFVFLQFH
jgi:hypothetical protein